MLFLVFCFVIVFIISIVQSLIPDSFIFLNWLAIFIILLVVTIFSFFWKKSTFAFKLFRINLLYQTFFVLIIFILAYSSLFQKARLADYVAIFSILSSPSLITAVHYIWKSLKNGTRKKRKDQIGLGW